MPSNLATMSWRISSSRSSSSSSSISTAGVAPFQLRVAPADAEKHAAAELTSVFAVVYVAVSKAASASEMWVAAMQGFLAVFSTTVTSSTGSQPRSGYVRGSAHTSSWLGANRDLRKRVPTYCVGSWLHVPYYRLLQRA
jgi:hypothetical protein